MAGNAGSMLSMARAWVDCIAAASATNSTKRMGTAGLPRPAERIDLLKF
jgi:hypothetical protein